MKLILASNNQNKLRELRQLLSDMDIEVLSQREAGCDFEVEETGTTFAENAFLKADAVVKATGIAAIADDSGIMVEALNGEPGVYSARYAPGGHDASDYDRNVYLLYKLEGVENRNAKFVSSICCIFPDGSRICTEGECHGTIMFEQKGDGGFGYDKVFKPLGYNIGMAELSAGEKNAISHRGNALRDFKKKLREKYGIDQ